MHLTRAPLGPPNGPCAAAFGRAVTGDSSRLCKLSTKLSASRKPTAAQSPASHGDSHVEIELGKDGLFRLPSSTPNSQLQNFGDHLNLVVDGPEDPGSMEHWGFHGSAVDMSSEVVGYSDPEDSDFPMYWGPTLALPRPEVEDSACSSTSTPAIPPAELSGTVRIEMDEQLQDRLERALLEVSTSSQGPPSSTVSKPSSAACATPPNELSSWERKRTRSSPAATSNKPTLPSSSTSSPAVGGAYSKLLARAKASARSKATSPSTPSASISASNLISASAKSAPVSVQPPSSSAAAAPAAPEGNADRIKSLVQKFVTAKSESNPASEPITPSKPSASSPAVTALKKTSHVSSSLSTAASSGSKWGKILKSVASSKVDASRPKVKAPRRGDFLPVGAFAKRSKGTSATKSVVAAPSPAAVASPAAHPAPQSATGNPPSGLQEVLRRHGIPEDVLSAFMTSVDSGAFTSRTLKSIDTQLGVLLEKSSGLDASVVLSVLKSQPQMLQQSLELLIEKKEHLGKVLGCPSSDISRILKSSPTLWGLKIEGIISKMDALSSATGLHPAEVQRLVCRRPKLLTLKPETCARKLDALADMLHKPREKVVGLVCEIPTILDLNTDSLAIKLKDLAKMTGRSEGFVGQMAATKPILLTSSATTIQASWSILRSASSSVLAWESELERMPAATLVNLLLASKPKALRLRYIASMSKSPQMSLNSVVKMKTAQFNQEHPAYAAWLKMNSP